MNTLIAGAATTRFRLDVGTRLRDLVADAVESALGDAGVPAGEVGFVMFGNAAAGLLTGQEMIRAQTALAASSLAGVPTLSVENACASSSSAFHLGCMAIESGMHDVVVVVGAEKMSDHDRSRASRALATAMDVELGDDAGDSGDGRDGEGGAPRPVFMEFYAGEARDYMARSGATAADFAAVVAKNTANGAVNPVAQVRTPISVAEALAARLIADPLTRPMCSSIGDGAAALVLCSPAAARRFGLSGPRVLASVVASGAAEDIRRGRDVVAETAGRAYTIAGVGPEDVDVAEVHDAAAPAELIVSEQLGLAAAGDGAPLLRAGHTAIGGRIPINPSGGLLARGHAIGATGAAQLVELVDQLRGRCGQRQVEGARIAIAENAGGMVGGGPAACAITILGA